MATLSVEP